MAVASDNQGYIHGGKDRLDEFDGLIGHTVSLFGMGSFETHADEIGAVFFHTNPCHLGRPV